MKTFDVMRRSLSLHNLQCCGGKMIWVFLINKLNVTKKQCLVSLCNCS